MLDWFRGYSRWALIGVMCVYAVIASRSAKDTPGAIIRSDVLGYTGYLHALFIAHDLGHEEFRTEYVNITPRGTLNKYFAGEAVLLAPFYLAADTYAKATGQLANGYSAPYEHAIIFAALVYVFIGLLAFRSLLLELGITDATVAIVLLSIGLGTQLLQYAAVQPGWSHVYSYALFAVFLLLVQRIANGSRAWKIVACGGLLGLVVLVRPVNALVVLAIPVVLGADTLRFFRRLMANPAAIGAAALLGGCVLAVQPLLWYAQVGSFHAYGYQGEGFHWDRPAIYQVLFGFRRGLFLWTPVMVLAVLSMLLLFRSDRVRSLAALAYLVAITYVISSWWIWYYGSGFGSRVFVEHYPVLFIPLAFMLDRWRGRTKTAVMAFLIPATALELAQCYQYNQGILDREGMDRYKYARSFLRFDESLKGRFGGRYVVPPFNPNGMDTLISERWHQEEPAGHWKGRSATYTSGSITRSVMTCDTLDEFGPTFEVPAGTLPQGSALYFALGFDCFVARKDDIRDVIVVVSTEKPGGGTIQYESFPMETLPPESDSLWQHIEYRVAMQPIANGELAKFYFWNKHRTGRFLVSDLDMNVMAVRPY